MQSSTNSVVSQSNHAGRCGVVMLVRHRPAEAVLGLDEVIRRRSRFGVNAVPADGRGLG
jgi:hypothetical protein